LARATKMKPQGSFLQRLLAKPPSVTFLGLQLNRTPVVNGRAWRLALVVPLFRAQPTRVCVVQQRVGNGSSTTREEASVGQLRWVCDNVMRSRVPSCIRWGCWIVTRARPGCASRSHSLTEWRETLMARSVGKPSATTRIHVCRCSASRIDAEMGEEPRSPDGRHVESTWSGGKRAD